MIWETVLSVPYALSNFTWMRFQSMQQACLALRPATSTAERGPSCACRLELGCLVGQLLCADKDIHDLDN